MSIVPSVTLNSKDVADTPLPQFSHWGIWGTIIWSLLILAIFFALQVLTLAVSVIINSGPLTESELGDRIASAAKNGNALSLTIVVTSVACLGLVVGAAKLKRGSMLKEYFAIKLVPLKTMLKWMGLLAVILVLFDLVTHFLGRSIVPDFMPGAYASANPLLPFWFALVVAAPLFEEAFFRGFLFKGLELSLGPSGAIVVTAGLWAAIHLQYGALEIVFIFCLGLLLGTARVLSGSLLVPFGLHAITNLGATIETAFQM
jgi:membrane protease YdiL (CAAX protease family)